MSKSSILLLCCFFFFIFQHGQATESSPSLTLQQPAKITDFITSANGISFSLITPQSALSNPDYLGVLTPSINSVPIFATYIALPPDGKTAVSVTAQDKSETAVSAPYTLSEPMYLRDQKVALFRLHPFQSNISSHQNQHTHQLNVVISFNRANHTTQQNTTHSPLKSITTSPLILNAEQAQQWRSFPPSVQNAPGSSLPIDQPSYKIEVAEDGVYELDYDTLDRAGMPVNAVNPHTFEMMHNAEPVAYQFMGDDDSFFEPGESVRFFGSAFTGSRHDKLFVSSNIFWIWANGIPTLIENAPSQPPTPANSNSTSMSTLTIAPENDYFSTWTDRWSEFPNEPDAWYWDRLPHIGVGSNNTPYTYTIQIPYPDTNSNSNAHIIAEFTSRANSSIPNNIPYEVALTLNSTPAGTAVWNGRQNINITHTIPINVLNNGDNVVTAVVTTPDVLYLNRISISYQQQLVAQNNQIFFSSHQNEQSWQISGFSNGNENDFIVWDVGEQKRPLIIPMSSATISGTDNYQLTFNHKPHTATQLMATVTDNVKQPLSVEAYTAVDITPISNQAEWLTIIHPNVQEAATQLATHRQTQSNLTTHIVTITDIINQFGNGFATPAAIRNYLTYALGKWDTPPKYVLLFGDATLNPQQRHCQWSCQSGWDTSVQTDILTDLQFVDQYQGLIPTDYTLSLLVGDDLLPDLAIGRISASTNQDANIVVDKIINYEQNQTAFNQQLLFVADKTDAAGTFCEHNQQTGELIPSKFPQTHLCLPQNPTQTDVSQLQTAMYTIINNQSARLLNYRGHGSIQYWGSGSAQLLSVSAYNNALTNWVNEKPTVILSADCLDGHFAWPGVSSISETLLRHAGGGSAAHWSSSGLGTNDEHTLMHTHFYKGLFQLGQTTIGDVANTAKLGYLLTNNHQSPIYSFILQGDPALSMAWSQQTHQYLPFIQN